MVRGGSVAGLLAPVLVLAAGPFPAAWGAGTAGSGGAGARDPLLEGRVLERGTGEPLEGAWVAVDGGPPQPVDPAGRFAVPIPPGEHVVRLGAPGHAPVERRVAVPAERPVVVYLEPLPAEMELVVEARRDSPHVAVHVLDRERVESTPGTHGDTFRLVQSLPGVVVQREYGPRAGEVAIRGAPQEDSRFYVDGIEVPFLFHFQDYASILPTSLVERVEVYPSTFGAPYGNAVGGVFEVTTRDPEAGRPHGGLDVSLVNVGAWTALPLGGGGGVSASARRSYADKLSETSDQYTLWPVFWDALARATHSSATGYRYRFTALGGGDAYARLVLDPEDLAPTQADANPEMVYDRFFLAVAGTLEGRALGVEHRTVLAALRDAWRVDLDDARQDRTGDALRLRQDVVGAEGAFAAGGEVVASRTRRLAELDRAWPELEDEAPMLARGVPVDETLDRVEAGAYAEWRPTLGAWRVQPGLRVEGDTLSGSVTVDPRFTARVRPRDDLRVRMAAGRYSRFPTVDDLSPASGDPGLGPVRSWQAAAGLDAAVGGTWEVGVDGWGRWLQDAVDAPVGEAPRAVEGWAAGTELAFRYRLRERFFVNASLSLGRSVLDGHPSDVDQPYAAQLATRWKVGRGWAVALRYRYAAGLPYTPVVGTVYDGASDTWSPEVGEPNDARMPDFQKIDLRVQRTWTWHRYRAEAWIEAWWVPQAATALYPVYSFDYSEQAYVHGPSLVPLVGARAAF